MSNFAAINTGNSGNTHKVLNLSKNDGNASDAVTAQVNQDTDTITFASQWNNRTVDISSFTKEGTLGTEGNKYWSDDFIYFEYEGADGQTYIGVEETRNGEGNKTSDAARVNFHWDDGLEIQKSLEFQNNEAYLFKDDAGNVIVTYTETLADGTKATTTETFGPNEDVIFSKGEAKGKVLAYDQAFGQAEGLDGRFSLKEVVDNQDPAPKPPTAEPKPPTAEPKPPTAEPKPPTAEPKPPTAEPKPPTAEPKPPTAEPKPPTAEPKPPIPQPEPPINSDPAPVQTDSPDTLDVNLTGDLDINLTADIDINLSGTFDVISNVITVSDPEQRNATDQQNALPGDSPTDQQNALPGDSPTDQQNALPGDSPTDQQNALPGDSPTDQQNALPGDSPTDQQNALPGDSPTDQQNALPGDALPGDSPTDQQNALPGDSPTDQQNALPGDSPTDQQNALPGDSPTDQQNALPGDSPTDQQNALPGDSPTDQQNALPGDSPTDRLILKEDSDSEYFFQRTDHYPLITPNGPLTVQGNTIHTFNNGEKLVFSEEKFGTQQPIEINTAFGDKSLTPDNQFRITVHGNEAISVQLFDPDGNGSVDDGNQELIIDSGDMVALEDGRWVSIEDAIEQKIPLGFETELGLLSVTLDPAGNHTAELVDKGFSTRSAGDFTIEKVTTP